MVVMLDDDLQVLDNMRTNLELDDIEFTSFDNPTNFLDYFNEEKNLSKYTLFICDYSMRPITGVTTILEVIKNNELPEHTYLFTGNPNQIPLHELQELKKLNVKVILKSSDDMYDIIDDIFDI